MEVDNLGMGESVRLSLRLADVLLQVQTQHLLRE
jgi:hypothetical protein